MKMRNAVMWMSVLGLCLCTSSAWAAPKKKSKKAKAADTAAEVEPVAPAEPKSTDDLMKESVSDKKKAAPKPAADSDEAQAPADISEPDAWERPPAEEEKPKAKKAAAPAAEDLWDGRHFNVGLMAGYGLRMGGGLTTTINPYSLGFGLQGDYEFDSHLVVGLGGEYFIGGSDATARNNLGVGGQTISNNYILAHALVGYNWWITRTLILRPSLWVGAAIAIRPATPTMTGSVVSLLLGPGATLHYLFGESGWYFGGDVRFSVPLGRAVDTVSGFLVLLTLGKRF